MAAKNKVIAGSYPGKDVVFSGGRVFIKAGIFKKVYINKRTVESYEVVDETSRKSAASAVGRAAVGGFFLGPAGLAAGLSAKSKRTHTMAINFLDGNRSLIVVDDKLYKAILQRVF